MPERIDSLFESLNLDTIFDLRDVPPSKFIRLFNFWSTESNDTTDAKDEFIEQRYSTLVHGPSGNHATAHDLMGSAVPIDSVSEALDRHASEDEVGFECCNSGALGFPHTISGIKSSPSLSSPLSTCSASSASTSPSAGYPDICLPLSAISGNQPSIEELNSEVCQTSDSSPAMAPPGPPQTTPLPDTPSNPYPDPHINNHVSSTYVRRSLPTPPWTANLHDFPSDAYYDAEDDYRVTGLSSSPHSRSASPELMYPPSPSTTVYDEPVPDSKSYRSTSSDPCLPLSSNYRRSRRISSLPKRSLAEVDDDELEPEAAAQTGPSIASRRSKRQKITHVDPDEQDYADTADGNSPYLLNKISKAKKRRQKRKGSASTKRSKTKSCRNKGRSDNTCADYPNCHCTQCPSCVLCFSRAADYQRHLRNTAAHETEPLDPEKAYAEQRETHRLWCEYCGLLLGRVDARKRHEHSGSCGRARWTKFDLAVCPDV